MLPVSKNFKLLGLLFLCWLTAVSSFASETINYSYDDTGKLIKVSFESGTTLDYTYDLTGNRSYTSTNNSPPESIAVASPLDQSIDVESDQPQLSWAAVDPDPNDILTYYVYFGLDENPDELYATVDQPSLKIQERLNSLNTYYWKVLVKDNHNHSLESPVWSFTTENSIPDQVEILAPSNGNEIVPGTIALVWEAVMDPDPDDTISYDIYFSDTQTPALIEENYSGTSYDISSLEASKSYYWKVVAKDNHGMTCSSDVFAFNTLEHEAQVINFTQVAEDTTITKEDGPYIINSSITVEDGVTLAIEPGTIMKFGPGASLTIRGNLNIQGTEASPVIFTSIYDDNYGGDTNGDGNATTPEAGDWQGIKFYDGDGNSTLQYGRIQYASQSIYIRNSSPVIQYTTISKSENEGVYVYSGSPELSHLVIENCGSYGVYISSGTVQVLDSSFSGNGDYDVFDFCSNTSTIAGNTLENGIAVDNGCGAGYLPVFSGNTINLNPDFPLQVHPDNVGDILEQNTVNNLNENTVVNIILGAITKDAIWTDSFTYNILGNITVKGTDGDDGVTSLTLSAGARLEFAANIYVYIGAGSGDPGALIAQGTEENPITFTSNSEDPEAGDWGGLYLSTTADDDLTVLEYCDIQYASQAIYLYSSSPKISYARILNSLEYGVYTRIGTPELSHMLIEGCGSYGIYLTSGAINILDSSFSDNGNYDIYINSSQTCTVTGNTFGNGIMVYSGSLTTFSENTINMSSDYPLQIHPDNIGDVLERNTINNLGGGSVINVISGTITRDAIWSSSFIYNILGNITVKGTDGDNSVTSLTMDPGVRLEFAASTYLYVGAGSGEPGALIAQGSEMLPIVFTSNAEEPLSGSWGGLYFNSTTDDGLTVLEYCDIQYAGISSGQAVYIYSSSPKIAHTDISNSLGYGIYIHSGSPELSNLIIEECGKNGIYVYTGTVQIQDSSFSGNGNYDIYINSSQTCTVTGNTLENGIMLNSGSQLAVFSGNTINVTSDYLLQMPPDNVGDVLGQNTINNLSDDSVINVTSGTITKDASWPGSFTYNILGSITIKGTDGDDGITSLTLSPGVRLEFAANAYMYVGANSGDPGALIAHGTLENPIIFTSNVEEPVAGSWGGLVFYNTTDDYLTVLDYCDILYAGPSSGQAIYLYYSSPTISHTHIQYGLRYGIYSSYGSPDFSSLTLEDCSSYGIYINGGAVNILDSSFSGNGDYDIYINSSQTSTVTGNTIENGIKVNNGSQLAQFSGNTINLNPAYPLQMHPDNVGDALGQNTINNITDDSVINVISGIITKDAQWTDSVTFNVIGNITIKGTDGDDNGTSLTLDPGARLEFAPNMYLYVGASSGDPGALIAQGTSEAPIIFTSNAEEPVAGSWGGLVFYNTTDDNLTVLDYCDILYAGPSSGQAVYLYSSSPTISHTHIRYSLRYGIYTYSSSSDLNSLVVENCVSYGVFINNGAVNIQDSSFSGNGDYDIYINSSQACTVTGNTFGNGIKVNTGSHIFSDNTINLNPDYPLQVQADNIGELINQNTINNIEPETVINVSYGTITKDAVWTGSFTYNILGTITIKGTDGDDGVTSLTLSPGARLEFTANAYMYIGASSGDPGALIAQGTVDDPIIFTSNAEEPVAGSWGGLIFYNTTDDDLTVLDYCDIQYAGYSGSRAVYLYSSSPTISHTQIQYSLGYGIYTTSSSSDLSSLVVEDCCSYGIYVNGGAINIQDSSFSGNGNYDIYITSSQTSTVSGNTLENGIIVNSGSRLASFSGNTINLNPAYPLQMYPDNVGDVLGQNTVNNLDEDSAINVTTGTIAKDATWTDSFIYNILGTITIKGTDGDDSVTSLTLDPGARLEFATNTYLYVGVNSGDPGALIAQGTQDSPIVFTSNADEPAAGFWGGLYFESTADDDMTILEYCDIRYAGLSSGQAVFIQSSSPTIAYTTITDSLGYGIYINWGSPELSNLIVQECPKYGIYVYMGSVQIQDSSFIGNGDYDLYISSSGEIVVTGNTLENGIKLINGSLMSDFSGNTINLNPDYPLQIHPDNVGDALGQNTINNLTEDAVVNVMSGTITKDAVWNDSVTYNILGTITIKGTDGDDSVTSLTLDPGTRLEFASNTYLYVGVSSVTEDPGALIAQGSQASPIVFTSNAEEPSAGSWGGLGFYTSTDSSLTVLEYCDIQYAGKSGGQAIYVHYSSPTIAHTAIADSLGYGIYIRSGEPLINNSVISDCANYGIYAYSGYPSIFQSAIRNCGASGIYVYSGSLDINYSIIMDNADYGIFNGSSTPVDAVDNWWGDPSGPFHAVTNPDGTGSPVSDNVDYDPWLDEEPAE